MSPTSLFYLFFIITFFLQNKLISLLLSSLLPLLSPQPQIILSRARFTLWITPSKQPNQRKKTRTRGPSPCPDKIIHDVSCDFSSISSHHYYWTLFPNLSHEPERINVCPLIVLLPRESTLI